MIPLHDDNPTELFPYITISIIVICTLAFFWQLSLDPRAQQFVMVSLGVIPATLVGGKSLPPELSVLPPFMTVFTSMFLHGGWLHIIGNMLYLWIFGNNVEDAMGHRRFIVFYFLCGIAAAMTQSLLDPESTAPMIGASGAIAGVLGAYLLLHPRARILVVLPLFIIFFTVRLPALIVLGFWFVGQAVSTLFANGESSGIAFGAHVGGFITGIVLIPLFKYKRVQLFSQASRRN
ncbi:MAG: rhomboid family intramembrane serine protease [Acidiferrobacterales bacterium]